MSTWYKFPCDYWTQPRMFQLKRILKSDALWIPARLWSFAAAQDGSGSVAGYEPAELAEALGYRGDADQLLAALKQTGYIYDDGSIVGWNELFGLAASRVRSAKIASDAARTKRAERQSERQEEKREEERERGECHGFRDGHRDGSNHTHTNASLFSLDDPVRNEVAADFSITTEGVFAAERVFRENKANFPSDPLTVDAFRGWLRTSKDGKEIRRRFESDGAAPQVAYDGPDGWREWVRENAQDPSWAERSWASLDRSQQQYIREQVHRA